VVGGPPIQGHKHEMKVNLSEMLSRRHESFVNGN